MTGRAVSQIERQRTFGGVSIPSAGRVGWLFGTDRWADGESFGYRVADLELITASS